MSASPDGRHNFYTTLDSNTLLVYGWRRTGSSQMRGMIMNIVEVDINYLTNQYIEMLPVRSKLTVRFQDRSNTLTRMLNKLEQLEVTCRQWPEPTSSISQWMRDRAKDHIPKLQTKLSKKTEQCLRRELRSSREMKLLVREAHDKSVFIFMDKAKRNQIHAIFTSRYRLFEEDWVNTQVRIFDPAGEHILAIA
jgi:hypothetical protein